MITPGGIAALVLGALSVGYLVVEGIRCHRADRAEWLEMNACADCGGEHDGWPLPGEAGFLCDDCLLARPPFCRACGCTDEMACPGGCWWARDPFELGLLCTRCAPAERAAFDQLREALS